MKPKLPTTSSGKKKRYFAITTDPDGDTVIVSPDNVWNQIQPNIDDGKWDMPLEEGEEIVIRCFYLTDKEVEALPEYEG